MKSERSLPLKQGASRFHTVNVGNAPSTTSTGSNKLGGFHIGYGAKFYTGEKLPRDFDSVKKKSTGHLKDF